MSSLAFDNGSPDDIYDPKEEFLRAYRQRIYESMLSKEHGDVPFIDERGLRLDAKIGSRPGGREKIAKAVGAFMFGAGNSVIWKNGYGIPGTSKPTDKGIEKSVGRYADPNKLLRRRQSYETALAIPRSHFYRVLREPVAAGIRFTVWPMPPGVNRPQVFDTRAEAEAAATRYERDMNPLLTRRWWKEPPETQVFSAQELQFWLPDPVVFDPSFNLESYDRYVGGRKSMRRNPQEGWKYIPSGRYHWKCPYSGQDMFGKRLACPPGGVWGIESAIMSLTPEQIGMVGHAHRRLGQQAMQGRSTERETGIERLGLEIPTRLTPVTREYDAPLLRELAIEKPGAPYREVELARLLDRFDESAGRYVTTMFLRMWERQTADEQRAGAARYQNVRGFNAGDAKMAKKIVAELHNQGIVGVSPAGRLTATRSPSREIHAAISSILMNYLRQMLDIAEEGRAATQARVRTNPRPPRPARRPLTGRAAALMGTARRNEGKTWLQQQLGPYYKG